MTGFRPVPADPGRGGQLGVEDRAAKVDTALP